MPPLGWLVSYPKSGNTWLRVLLDSLFDGGGPVDINGLRQRSGLPGMADLDELFGIESSDLSREELVALRPAYHRAVAADADKPLILRKVHDRYWHTAAGEPAFPAEVSRGAVYLVRDPRDVAVSFAHHRGCTLDEIIALMADERTVLAEWANPHFRAQQPQPLGSWSSHAGSWLDQTEIPVLLLRYEDLHADPHTALAAVARHFGVNPSPQAVAGAVEAARFERLRAQEAAAGFTERPPYASAPFFRSGRVGDWRHRLAGAHADAILARHETMMRRLGYA